MPLRPRNGIHEIMRMMFEVRNGMVQTRNRPICQSRLLTMEHQEVGDVEAQHERHRPYDGGELQMS